MQDAGTRTSTSAGSTSYVLDGVFDVTALRPASEVQAQPVRRRHAGARRSRTDRSTTTGSTPSFTLDRRRIHERQGRAASTSASRSRRRSASASRIRASTIPTSPDYNPNLAPYDLTRGGTLFEFHGSAHRHVLRRLHPGQHPLRRTSPRTSGSATTQQPSRGRRASSSRGSASRTTSTGSRTVLRASYNRVFVHAGVREHPVQLVAGGGGTLVPPAVRDSRELGGGVLLVRSERQNAYTVGVQQAVGRKLRLDVDFWWRELDVRGRPGPVPEHRHRLPDRVQSRATTTAGTCGSTWPRRTACAASCRSATRTRSTSRRRSAGCSSTRGRSTPSRAARS